MRASKESCATKRKLLVAWQSSADAYSKAVAELSQKIGIVPKADYTKLTTIAENARKRALEAQGKLQAHIKDHGCNGGEVAA